MKQDSISASQLRGSQNEDNSKPLFAQIGKSFSFSQAKKNKLIFTSKSVPLVEPIAYSLLDSIQNNSPLTQELILLLDFESEEIDWLNECLGMMVLTSPLEKNFDRQTRKQLKVIRLNTLTIQKRKACYIKNGVYAVSCQIFLTDFLRGQAVVHPRHLSKIIVNLTQKIKNYYHYYAWLCTMMKMKEEKHDNKWSVPFIFICNKPQHYSFEEDLKQVYRVLFCEKVVIWPFGRAEIHKKLNQFRQKKSIKEWEHGLSHSDGEKEIQGVLDSTFKFLKKAHGIKYGDQYKQIEDLLYSRTDEQSFSATRGEYTEFQSIKSLFSQLENVNKVNMLNTIALYRQENHYDLWNSNNHEAIDLTESLIDKLKEGIFRFEKVEPTKIDLMSLLETKHSFVGIDPSKYQCFYDLNVKLNLKVDDNEKMNELIKIIQDLRYKKINRDEDIKVEKEAQKGGEINIDNEAVQEWKQVQKKLNLSEETTYKNRNILVICNTKRTYRYVSSVLKGYLSESGYLDYLLFLQTWLKSQSTKRQLIIKRIFDKRKIQIGEDRIPQVKISQKQKIEESKIILQEILLIQIEKILQLMLDYELQLNIFEEELKRAQSTGALFDVNREEAKVTEKINERLIKNHFQVIDITKIRLSNSRRKTGDIVFEGSEYRLKVVVEYFNRSAQLSHFYNLLKVMDPEILIFYSPSTTLLRSLYLYNAQNESSNLQSLHIMNYQDSYESIAIKQQVVKEDKAFWEITQKRSQLSQYRETPFARVSNLAMKDKYDKAIRSIGGKSMLRSEEEKSSFNLASIDFTQYRRVVIVDTREFKSSLPSYLFHSGFQVVPMFLKTADYILSDDIAIQKKSVNTKDLQTSIKTQRLEEQLKRMNSSFKYSYLLIEFQQEKDVKKDNFSRFQFSKGSRQNSEGRQIRKKLFQLINKYEKVRLLWSTSISQSCNYFKQLKTDNPEPDLLKFQKTELEEDIPSQQLTRISEVSSSKQNDA